MFVDFSGQWEPLPPSPPRPPAMPARGIGRTEERRLMLIVAINLVLLLVAPIGGATVIAALVDHLR